jgi:hypothetical protein
MKDVKEAAARIFAEALGISPAAPKTPDPAPPPTPPKPSRVTHRPSLYQIDNRGGHYRQLICRDDSHAGVYWVMVPNLDRLSWWCMACRSSVSLHEIILKLTETQNRQGVIYVYK